MYLASFREAFLSALEGRHSSPPVFAPTEDGDKARVLGYAEGMLAGDTARSEWEHKAQVLVGWSGAIAQPGSAANQSQPVASGTNLTSAAAGSSR